MTVTTDIPLVELDYADPAFAADPYPTYARLRALGPVVELKTRRAGRTFLVVRYDEVLRALKEPALSSDAEGASATRSITLLPRALRMMANSMVTTDDPDHARLRGLVHMAFTPRMVERMAGWIGEATEELLDGIDAAAPVDLIEGFALPLPIAVMSRMLGVPHDLSNQFRVLLTGLLDAPPPGTLGAAAPSASGPDHGEMVEFIDRLIALKRAEPDDGLIAALVSAEQAGDRLSPDELVGTVFLLLLAGHETTVNLIGNGVLALLDHPAELARLVADPGLAPSAVEEVLRLTNPVEHGVVRLARADLELGGCRIPAGSRVIAILSAANHDPAQFPDPDRLDIAREPNRHLAFGFGIHFCLGAPLARLEGAAAFAALARRFPRMALAEARDRVRWRPANGFRGLYDLPVTLSPPAPR